MAVWALSVGWFLSYSEADGTEDEDDEGEDDRSVASEDAEE